MTAEKVTATQTLPTTDQLWLTSRGTYVRVRVVPLSDFSQVMGAMPEPGCHEQVRVSIRCSIAKDATGDVREEPVPGTDTDAHVLIAEERHCIDLSSLMNGSSDFDTWLGEKILAAVLVADQKAFLLDQVLSKFS